MNSFAVAEKPGIMLSVCHLPPTGKANRNVGVDEELKDFCLFASGLPFLGAYRDRG
jgi:hypothetical protein